MGRRRRRWGRGWSQLQRWEGVGRKRSRQRKPAGGIEGEVEEDGEAWSRRRWSMRGSVGGVGVGLAGGGEASGWGSGGGGEASAGGGRRRRKRRRTDGESR
uniref:Uncharacterized protein n=2 Tax=Oryza TaxID=4527 RepID=Q2QRE5_ORYSJ|nr:hypothetical protein LOC_Os12g27840 [Oryza sativa Japonica Group]